MHGKAFTKYKWQHRLRDISLLLWTTRHSLNHSPQGQKNSNHSNNDKSSNNPSTYKVPNEYSVLHTYHPWESHDPNRQVIVVDLESPIRS